MAWNLNEPVGALGDPGAVFACGGWEDVAKDVWWVAPIIAGCTISTSSVFGETIILPQPALQELA